LIHELWAALRTGAKKFKIAAQIFIKVLGVDPLSDQAFGFLLANYLALMIISAIISAAYFFQSKVEIAKTSFYYWLSIIGGAAVQGWALQNPPRAGLAMLSSLPSAILMLRLLKSCFHVPIRWRLYGAFVAFTAVAGVLTLSLGYSFELYATFFSLAVAFPVTVYLFATLPQIRKVSVGKKLFWLACFLCISHLYNYPLFRLASEWQVLVFVISFWNGFFTAVAIPLVIMDSIKDIYASSLETKVEVAAADLKQKNSALTTAIRDKNNLVRVLCHDIANLITIADGSVRSILKLQENEPNLLIPQNRSQELRKYLYKLMRSIQSQMDLVRNVRYLMALDSGKILSTTTVTDLVTAIHESIELQQYRANDKQITITFKAEIAEAHVVVERSILIHCILGNFLSNAIKFSPSQNTVDVSLDRESSYFICIIQDHGMGMSRDKIATLFSDKCSTSTTGTQGEQGTGFGMPIAKQFCDLYNIALTIDSTPQDGTHAPSGTVIKMLLPVATQCTL
jgi:signal transduction histidine kinase